MNVIFVNYFDFTTPSGMHIFHLANALSKLGVRCATYNNGDAATVTRYGNPRFRAFDARLAPHRLVAECNFAAWDTVIHCWTPRECPRHLTAKLKAVIDAPVVIHMEDNEEAITMAHLEGLPTEERESEDLWQPPNQYFYISHPERHREFLAGAEGYTCIIESLLDFKPDAVPGHVFWPSCEPEVFDLPLPSSAEEKGRWGIAPDEKVIFYPGNLHQNNAEEVTQLYAAVSVLRARGLPLRIIKFGRYDSRLMELIRAMPGMGEALVDLTETIIPAFIPALMRAVDYLVQPGRDNAFNRYRFPCKLPLFMASGRPVILPRTNLGALLTHGENCLLLQDGESCTDAIVGCIHALVKKPDMAIAIGAAGREFARTHFSWAKSAAGLKEFYAAILAKRGNDR